MGIVKIKGIATSAAVAIIVIIAIAGIGGYFVLKGKEEIKEEEGEEGVPVPAEFEVGETAKTPEMEVTIISAEGANYYTDEDGDVRLASSGKIFVIIDAEVKYVGTDSDYVYGGDFWLIDSETHKYEYASGTYSLKDGFEGTTLYPNQTQRGKILFEIPEDVKYLKVQCDLGSYLEPELVSWEFEFVVSELTLFELKSPFEVIDDGGVAKLKFSCYSPVSIDLFLSDPNLNQIGWDYISDTAMEDGSEASLLRLADYGETPIAGTYSLVVNSSFPVRTLYTKKFTFSGADLKVISCTPSWTYWFYLGYYSLDGLSIEVRNDGDLPTYISRVDVTIAGKEDEGIFLISESGVLPNQSKTLEDTFYISEIPSGTHTMSLTLKDYGGNILATYSTTVTPST